jgi:hypothetical protein
MFIRAVNREYHSSRFRQFASLVTPLEMSTVCGFVEPNFFAPNNMVSNTLEFESNGNWDEVTSGDQIVKRFEHGKEKGG